MTVPHDRHSYFVESEDALATSSSNTIVGKTLNYIRSNLQGKHDDRTSLATAFHQMVQLFSCDAPTALCVHAPEMRAARVLRRTPTIPEIWTKRNSMLL